MAAQLSRTTARRAAATAVTWLVLVLACSDGEEDVRSRPAAEGAPCPDCDVVVISIDTLRADHTSGYGYVRATTPEIDAFFGEGTRFRNAISASPCTIPSVGQMLTGRIVPDDDDPRLAEVAARRGHATAAVVSQHFFRDADGPLTAYARGFEHFDVQAASQVDRYRMTTRTATEVTDRALAVLADRDPARPLFLWLHYFDPHDPYTAPEPWHHFEPRTSDTIDGDRRKTMRDGRGTDLPWERRGEIFTAEEEAFLVAQYDAEISYVDAEIGRFLDGLRESGRVERSLVLLTSDHGERLGEEARWDHCASLHGREIDVPLLALLAGGPLAGVHDVEAAASTLDVWPTVAELLGHEPDPALPGRSLLEVAGAASADRVVVTAWKDQRLALAPPWKLVIGADGAPQLLDLAADPDETHDLAPERPAVVERLRAEIERRAPSGKRVDAQSDRTREQLEAIGYLE